MDIELSKSDKRKLRLQFRPLILLLVGIFITITLVNLAFHFMDVLTGVESVERPPLIRLVAIEMIAFIIVSVIYYLMTKKVRLDLKSGKKISQRANVNRKFFQKENGRTIYKVQTENGKILEISKEQFTFWNSGDQIEWMTSTVSGMVLSVKKL
jgi:hypothetical protein